MQDYIAVNALRARYARRVYISNLVPYLNVFSNRYEFDPPSLLTQSLVDLSPPIRPRGWYRASQTRLPHSLVELAIDQELNTPQEVLTILKSAFPVD